MKKIIAIATMAIISYAADAQSPAGAGVQNARLDMADAIMIGFSGASATVDVPFNSLTDMLNGVETATHQVTVSSNKSYKVTVNQASNNMSYVGSLSVLGSLLQVSSVIKVRVMNNNTGGYQPLLAALFGWQSFDSNGTPVTLLSSCDAGNNKTFSVKYKVTPGMNFNAGTYTADMVYTATQQ